MRTDSRFSRDNSAQSRPTQCHGIVLGTPNPRALPERVRGSEIDMVLKPAWS